MLNLVLTLENCIEPPSYARKAYVVVIWRSFLFDSFVKIWATWKIFLGKWFTAPPDKKIPVRLWIYRSGVCYLRTCNRKGVHKQNFDCLWDPELCTLESKVSFIASLQVDFLRDEVSRSFASWPITHPKKGLWKSLCQPYKKKFAFKFNLHSLNRCKLRKSILTTIYSLNFCFESGDLDWALNQTLGD